MYGEEALYEDALNILLPESYENAVKDSDIDPVDQPQISVESMEKGKPWVIKATVYVKPEVKLGDYEGLSVPKQNTRVYQKDIDAELEKRRESQAELVLKEGKAAEMVILSLSILMAQLTVKHLMVVRLTTTHLNWDQTHSSLALKIN
ncbi:cell division trigger factor [Lentilactobacillus kosonis]|uniref:Cell division trigger factor n=1 Tax=Lentilactobacillus kosonis TaxID=2810561 RepID=A0A401FPJ3_9LACO|nr:cell division trigger factor [Lentilactobacillus kosonis]